MVVNIKQYSVLFAGLTAIIGLYASAPSIGLDLPRFAWASEVQAVHKQVVGTRITLYDFLVTSSALALTQNMAIQAEYNAKKTPIPDYFLQEEQALRERVNDEAQALQRYRDEYATLDK